MSKYQVTTIDDHDMLPVPQDPDSAEAIALRNRNHTFLSLLFRALRLTILCLILLAAGVAGIYYEAQAEKGGTPSSTYRHVIEMIKARV